MSMQKFNPDKWRRNAALTPRDEVEIVTRRIEEAALDITGAYNDWLSLGFALADGLGEEGRAYFHRLSRFYGRYNVTEADRQYNACLRSQRQGITLNTFFHLARQAGVDIRMPESPESSECQNARMPEFSAPCFPAHAAAGAPPVEASAPLPAGPAVPPPPPSGSSAPLAGRKAAPQPGPFPDDVYASLPRLLADVCSYGLSPEDTDMLLLGAVTVLSSCLTRVTGLYGQREVCPNLFLFVSARASAGKGRLTLCRHLVDVVHADLRRRNRLEWEEYRHEKALYDKQKRKETVEEPPQPPVRMLFIPANSTATALFQTLNDNEGRALMFETEGDTLANTFRSEHGNYSDGLRKSFHHESIAYNRRKDREYVEINRPCLSVLLSGTPRQIMSLIPDAENGLFSRFLFYSLPLRPVWNDVFADCGGETIDGKFIALGGRFFSFFTRLQSASAITFELTAEQQREFNRFFGSLQDEGMEFFGEDILSSVRRLGLSAYRMCMVFSSLRLMEYEGDTPLPARLGCRDDDFHTVLLMMRTLLSHTGAVYAALQAEVATTAAKPPTPAGKRREERREAFLRALPPFFSHSLCLEVAEQLEIPVRTAERFVVELCNSGKLRKKGYGAYGKPE